MTELYGGSEHVQDLTEIYLGALLNLVAVSQDARERLSKQLGKLEPFLRGDGETLCRAASIM